MIILVCDPTHRIVPIKKKKIGNLVWETCPSKKEIQVPFGAPLFLGKWYGVATYFSLYKKIIKNTNYKIHDWIVPFIDWLKIWCAVTSNQK